MRAALSIPTMLSMGECIINNAFRKFPIVSFMRVSSRSSKNCFLRVNFLPANITSASPFSSISSRAVSNSLETCSGSQGAPIVVTASTDRILSAACSTAAPPNECPMSNLGAWYSDLRKSAAAIRSSTLEEKLVSAKSPSLSPNPVKSNRRTAIPSRVNARLILPTAFKFFEQVKQWANSAKAFGLPSNGKSRRAASFSPALLLKWSFSDFITCPSSYY